MAATTATDRSAREENAYTLGVQALLWGYPLVCYARTTEAAVRAGASHVNAFRLHTELKTAADRYVVTPNNVTLDGYAALDLREEPVVVHVPALAEPRWYIVQLGDVFDEVATNIGGVKGPGAGAYAVCGPGFRGELPGEISKVRLRTTQAICAARVFVNGRDDMPGAVATLRGFHAMPLSAYLREGLRYEPPQGVTAPALSDDGPAELRAFDHLGQAMRWMLPIGADRADPLVAAFNQIGLSVAHGFAWHALDPDIGAALTDAAAMAEQIVDARWADLGEPTNGWRYNTAGGRAGHDFALRAALAKGMLGAQLATEVLYPTCAVDSAGDPLDGEHAYELHFPAGQVPPVAVFWNLALYGQDMLFVENDLGRYSIGSTTDGLAANADGSLTLHIQRGRPGDDAAAANWLPAPKGPFNLTLRFYGPASSVLEGSYRLPAVTRK